MKIPLAHLADKLKARYLSVLVKKGGLYSDRLSVNYFLSFN